WTRDDSAVYFHTDKTGEVTWLSRIYTAPVEVGQTYRAIEAGGFDATISPDGRWLAFARGASRWWRTGYRGSANWDLWVRDMREGTYRQVTQFDGTDMQPVWNRSGTGLYFLSDRLGLHQVWYQPISGGDEQGRQITSVEGHRVRDFSVSADERRLAFT